MIGLNLDNLVALITLIMITPALLLFLIGYLLSKKNNKKAAKTFFILGVVYLVISFGTCGFIMK